MPSATRVDISDIAAVSSLALVLAFAAWAAWQVLSERVRCSERELVKRHGWRRESMALPDIAQFQHQFAEGDAEDTIEVWGGAK